DHLRSAVAVRTPAEAGARSGAARKQSKDPRIHAPFLGQQGQSQREHGPKDDALLTLDELKKALEQSEHKDLQTEADALNQSLFDPAFEPMMTAKNPEGGKDILEGSANNFYSGVSLADLKTFNERYRLNSRVVKEGGRIQEEVYRAGT